MGPRRSRLEVVFAWLVAVPLVYVLSRGPVVKLHSVVDVEPSTLLLTFYAPLIWTTEHNHVAKRILGGYLALWGTQ